MGDKLVAWLQVIGNFGLILGLVLVGIQIKQNSDLTRVQTGHDAWLFGQGLAEARMGENPQTVLAKMWLDPESLSDEELVAAENFLFGVSLNVRRVEYMTDSGIDQYSEELIALDSANALASSVGRAWWALNRAAVAIEAPRISDRIDGLLAGAPLRSASYYKQLRADIKR